MDDITQQSDVTERSFNERVGGANLACFQSVLRKKHK